MQTNYAFGADQCPKQRLRTVNTNSLSDYEVSRLRSLGSLVSKSFHLIDYNDYYIITLLQYYSIHEHAHMHILPAAPGKDRYSGIPVLLTLAHENLESPCVHVCNIAASNKHQCSCRDQNQDCVLSLRCVSTAGC
jgi:hypothetical protein